MTPQQLETRAKAIPGVEALNKMQARMLATGASRILLLAPTGSGKTIAFVLRLLKNLTPNASAPSAVIIAPTRELAIQIGSVVSKLAPELRSAVLYGGHPMFEEVNSLSVTPDIIIATPGRLLDHALRSTVYLGKVFQLIIDEYDKCLELGFLSEMKRLVKRMPSLREVILTSATNLNEMPDFIDFSQGKILDFSSDKSINSGVTEYFISPTEGKDKLDDAAALVASLQGRTMLFVNHRESAERVFNGLKSKGLPAGIYHGGLEQPDREKAIVLFENGTTPILVTTDLASRGLDIESVENIVHYHLPLTEEVWHHRNGRTARMGANGKVFVLQAPEESLPDFIEDAEIYKIPEFKAPEGAKTATLRFSAGKKDKISRGDIVGFLVKSGGIQPGQIGKIDLKERCAYVAVPQNLVSTSWLDLLNAMKIKKMKVRISPAQPL